MVFKTVAKIFWEYLKLNPIYIVYNIFFMIITVINNFYLPKIYGEFYDTFQKNINLFMYSFIFILFLKGLVFLFYQLESYYFHIQCVGVEETTQRFIISKIKEKFIQSPEEVIIGEKLIASLKIQKIVRTWYYKVFQYLIPYFFTIISSAIYMFKIDSMLPIFLGILMIGAFLTIFSNIYLCYEYCFDSNNKYLILYQEIEDYLSNILTIQTYNQFKNEDKNIQKHNIAYQESNKVIAKCSLSSHLIGVSLTIICLFIIMYRSFRLLKNNIIKKSEFMSLYFIITSLLGSLVYLTDLFQNVAIEYNNLVDIQKISGLQLFDTDKDKNENDKNKEVIKYGKIKTDSLIKVVDLEYRYPSADTSIINNLNLEIKKGERIALVGDIGAGKSTLLKIILGLLKPRSGDIFLNGHNYKKMDYKDLFNKFGYMTQTPILFNRSILDNILFSNPNSTRKQVVDLLEEFELNDVFNKMEKGIDTLVGKNGSKISGGQKQVVWFLRIYLHNPEILLLDEPTASLSTKSKETLWRLIKKGFNGKTIIMASHDDFLIKMATRKIKI